MLLRLDIHIALLAPGRPLPGFVHEKRGYLRSAYPLREVFGKSSGAVLTGYSASHGIEDAALTMLYARAGNKHIATGDLLHSLD
jgi:hypothetical protein